MHSVITYHQALDNGKNALHMQISMVKFKKYRGGLMVPSPDRAIVSLPSQDKTTGLAPALGPQYNVATELFRSYNHA